MLKIGDKIITEIEGIVVDSSDAHGECYEIELPESSFTHKRKIWVEQTDIPIFVLFRDGFTLRSVTANDITENDINKVIKNLEELKSEIK